MSWGRGSLKRLAEYLAFLRANRTTLAGPMMFAAATSEKNSWRLQKNSAVVIKTLSNHIRARMGDFPSDLHAQRLVGRDPSSWYPPQDRDSG